ncbi:DUF11 domain-containing protein [Actinomadura roseirufa]|uniref:DUF11 domain-containing protein n=1 Tax=Actinomadura roseirufa TaxID=2094049 RepID=UPI0010418FBA|nr:DUF11 domain-containing protein [Actinomadura roseirufa]
MRKARGRGGARGLVLLAAAPLLGVVPMLGGDGGALADGPSRTAREGARRAVPGEPEPTGGQAGAKPRPRPSAHATPKKHRKPKSVFKPRVHVMAEAPDLSNALGDKAHEQKTHPEKAHAKKGRAPAATRAVLSVSGPAGTVVPGGVYSWPFAVTARGRGKPARAVLVARLPKELSFVSGQPDCAESKSTGSKSTGSKSAGPKSIGATSAERKAAVVCRLGPLRPGQTIAGLITARVSRKARPDQLLQGHGTVIWGEARATQDFPPVRVARTADVAMTINAPAQAKPGKAIPYETRVRNLGPSTAENVVVRSDGRTRLVGHDTACIPQGAGYACAVGALAPGEERTLHSRVLPARNARVGAVVESSSRAAASTIDVDPANNRAVARTRITRAPGRSVSARSATGEPAGGPVPVAYTGDAATGASKGGANGGAVRDGAADSTPMSRTRPAGAGGAPVIGRPDTGTIVELAVGMVGAAFVLTRLGVARRRGRQD